jgi:hypothetical protein
MEVTLSQIQGKLAFRLPLLQLMCRFHYKPSVAWPPAPGDGITVTMPDGSEAHFDEQVQMYW